MQHTATTSFDAFYLTSERPTIRNLSLRMSTGGPKNHGLTIEDADRLLESIINFPDINAVFERVRPLTDFRKDDDEARILYICRRTKTDGLELKGESREDSKDELYVLKCKVQ